MIAIVTDSTSDLPSALAGRHAITVVPTILVVEGQPYADGAGLSRAEFYDRLPGMRTPPTTAAPAAGEFAAVYERALSAGAAQVFSIHLSAALSGVYNAAAAAAQDFGGRVHVFDSGFLTMSLGFQALAAASARQNGLPAILAAVESVKRRSRLLAFTESLEFLRRSGRVSSLRAGIGSLLRVRLFLTVRHGVVEVLTHVRTRSRAAAHLAELLAAEGPLERLAVLHANAEADAQTFAAQFSARLPEPPLIVNVTPVIGTHVGPGAMGVAAVTAS